MLSDKEIEEIKEELHNCKKPLFFFHDDPDGLCSFLLLYRYVREGSGVVVKSVPNLDEKFISKVTDYGADKVFILDLAMVDQDFIDSINVPAVWIDHHEIRDVRGVKYYNPRKHGKATPVTYMCYQIANQNLWIAMCGCIGDWYLPSFYEDFKKQYPGLINIDSKNPAEILFTTEIGKLCKILSFVLKGKTSDAMKCVKIMTRIETPEEILNQETPRGKFIFKRYEKINEEYEVLLNQAVEKKSDDKFLIFTYPGSKMSFTGDLSNELLYKFPDKIIIVGREKSGEIRMSLRSKDVELPSIINKALSGLVGYGGGHEYACGANVKKKDFELFVSRLRKAIG